MRGDGAGTSARVMATMKDSLRRKWRQRAGRASALVLSLTLVFLSMTACEPKGPEPIVLGAQTTADTVTTGSATAPAVPADLGIIHVAPSGAIEGAEGISVVFDRPMVALTTMSADAKPGWVAISPATAGQWRWVGDRVLTFSPAGGFAKSTSFELTVGLEATALDGAKLLEPRVSAFQTPAPRLSRFDYGAERESMPLEPSLVVFYDQPVRQADFEERLLLRAGEGTINARVRRPTLREIEHAGLHWDRYAELTGSYVYDVGEADPAVVNKLLDEVGRRGFVVTPSAPLSPDEAFVLTVAAGLPGEGGNRGTEKALERKMRTYGPLGFEMHRFHAWYDSRPELELGFTNPLEAGNVESSWVRVKPKIKGLKVSGAGDRLELQGPFRPDKVYTVTISKDVADRFGQRLGASRTFTFRTPHVDASMNFAAPRSGVIERYGRLSSLPLRWINVTKPQVDWYRLTPATTIPFLRETPLWTHDADALAGKTGVVHWTEKRRMRWDREERKDLSLRQDHGPEGGLFFFQVNAPGFNPWKGESAYFQRQLYNVTDLGLVAKLERTSLRLAVSSFKKGGWLPGVALELRDAENKVLWSGLSSETGFVSVVLPKGKEQALLDKAGDLYVFAIADKEFTYLKLDYSAQVGLYSIDVFPQRSFQDMRAVVWPDKGIYRKGETVHLAGVLRERDKGGWRVPTGESFNMRVNNPVGDEVHKEHIVLTSQGAARFGAFGFDVPIPSNWTYGVYEVSLTGDDYSASTSFEVGVYRKPTFAVDTSMELAHAYPGGEIGALSKARYYFGAPLSDASITWRALSREQAFAPPGHPDFSFDVEHGWGEDEGQGGARSDLFEGIVVTERAVVDAKGESRFSLTVPGALKKSKRVTVEGAVRDLSGNEVTGSVSFWAHPATCYLGLRVEQPFNTVGATVITPFVVASPEGEAVFGRKVELALFRREWVKEVKAGLGAAAGVRYKLHFEPIEEQVMVSGDGSIDVEWVPPKPGSYVLKGRVYDPQGHTTEAEQSFYVAGGESERWYEDSSQAFRLIPEKDSYAIGDTARVLLKSPMLGVPAIVTIERDRVLSERMVMLDEALEVLEIKVTEEMRPNVFVSVTIPSARLGYARGSEPDHLYKPALRIGYGELHVDTSAQRFKLTVNPDRAVYGPGDKVTLDLQAPEVSNLVVQVVDKAVLDLTGYGPPDLHGRFWADESLGVMSYSSYGRLLDQPGEKRRALGDLKGDAMGGGGSGGGASTLRSDFSDVAFYAHDVVTDEEGHASVTFSLPDNVTEYRVIVVAVAMRDRFGAGEGGFQVAKPFLALPSAPERVSLGDEFELSFSLVNTSDQAGEVKVQLAPPPFISAKRVSASATLPAKGSVELSLRLKAEHPGDGAVQVVASFGDASDRLSIPVRSVIRYPVEDNAFFGNDTTSAAFSLAVPKDVIADFGGVEFGVANTAFVGLEDGFKGLLEYPYGCTEQLSSRLIAYARASRLPPVALILGKKPAQIKAEANAIIGTILARQRWSGGFSFWDQGKAYAYASAYATMALDEAFDAGFAVPRSALDRAYEHLLGLLGAEKPDGMQDERSIHALKSMLVSVLLNGGQTSRNFEDKLVGYADPLPSARLYLAGALATRPGVGALVLRLVEPILNKVVVNAEDAFVETDSANQWGPGFGSRVKTTAMLLSVLQRLDRAHPFLGPMARWLVKHLGSKRLATTTHDRAYALMALCDYYDALEEEAPDFDIEVRLGNETVMRDHMAGVTPELYADRISMASIGRGEAVPLTFSKKGPGRMYYHARLRYALRSDVTKIAPKANGFTLARRMFSLDGEPVAEAVRRGEPFLVELDVIAPGARSFVVLDDPLPAGIEAVHLNFETVSPSLKKRFADLLGDLSPASYDHREIAATSVRFFVDEMGPGLHRFVYLARPAFKGSYTVPGARVFEMYNPETFASTAGTALRIE